MNINISQKETPLSIPWLRIVAFGITATLLAYPFRNNIFGLNDILLFGVPVLQALLEGIGVLIATVIFTRGFQRFWKPVNFLGDLPTHALFVWAVPVMVLLIFGVNNSTGVNPHLFGLILGVSVSVYCLFEESGWRGFLQNATMAIPRWARYLVVGIIWYVWHLSFLETPINIASQIKFLLILVGASYLLGSLVDKTNSVLLAASFHFIINMMAFNRIGGITASGNERLFLIGLIILIWIPVLIHWNVREKNNAGHSSNRDHQSKPLD